MSANASDQPAADQTISVPAPKPITNAQTVCNEKNAKNKPCWGHLKQLRTAGEPAEIHLRGDDVLFKCQTCGTLYMGPPLGHVRDPYKQRRFVEAELSALLQAAGGTLPVIKKNERGVYVLVEADAHGTAEAKPAAKPVPAAKPTAAPASSSTAAAPPKAATAPAPKPAAHKAGAEPNRQLFRRSTYAGVADTGPVPGETFEQKVARLKAVSAAAKQRAEEGGGEAPRAVSEVSAAPSTASAVDVTSAPAPETAASTSTDQSAPAPATTTDAAASPAPAPSPAASAGGHKPTGQADRTLMRRSTYAGVTDTGPVPGETFDQKVERLRAVAAAAKQRAEGG